MLSSVACLATGIESKLFCELLQVGSKLFAIGRVKNGNLPNIEPIPIST